MPKKPDVPCKHQGCPKLVLYGTKYCDEHKGFYRNDVRSAGKRGYNRRWRKASKIFLLIHPLCENCKSKGKYTKATVVDHIKPHRGDSVLFWDKDNWQALCKHCHDVKTATEERYIEYRY